MDIESLLISKNHDKFSNLLEFMRSLIVKNEVEAEEVETTDTLSDYERYEGAFLQHDSSLAYSLSYNDMLDFGFTELEATKYSTDQRKFQSDMMKGKILCKSYMSKIRKQRVSDYVENNKYYRQFCGLPYDSDQYISVVNSDRENESDPEVLYLHNVNMNKYPKTYARLYYERDIENIYKDYNYLYLIFIEHPMTPYEIRNKEQFDICYYSKAYLDSSELQYWFEVYNMAKTEIMSIDYIEAFQVSYKAYVNIMFLFILQYAFNLYCSKMLEKYAIRNYSDSEIYDILDSNGLGNLKSLNISLLRRIVQRLPDIKAYTGTNNVIDILFDIVADDSLTVKRYYLNKKYNTDAEGNTSVDKTNLYDKSVDLVFVEKTTNKGENASNTMDVEYSYENITMSDDTWGGTQDIDDEDKKLAIKNDIKKELLATDFNSIMTKYIGLTKIIDMHIKLTEVNYKLGLFYQYNNLADVLSTDSTIFNGVETTPICVYAAWCMIYGTLNGLSDPDHIISERTTIEGMMKLRTTDKIQMDTLNLSSVSIDLGNGYYRTLGDYLTQEEIQKYLVKFNVNKDSKMTDVLDAYDENFEIIKAIQNKIEESYNFDEYQVWNTMLKANLESQTIKNLFGNATSYSGFIKKESPSFYENFVVLLGEAKTPSALRSLAARLHESFSDYLASISNNGLIYATSEDDVIGGEDLTDISMLFNQFMSVYTQLFKQDSHISYDDHIENTLALLYASCLDILKTTDRGLLDLSGYKLSDVFKTVGLKDYLELLYFTTDTVTTKETQELVLEDEMIAEIRKFIFRDYPELIYEKISDIYKAKESDTLSLGYKLISDKIITMEK